MSRHLANPTVSRPFAQTAPVLLAELPQTVTVPCPRVMIAAPHGRSGKTVVTLGLLRAFSLRGVDAQPFKKGPDFIDPGWHSLACHRTSRNLDSFFMTPDQIRTVLGDVSAGSQISLLEAAMGFFDGTDCEGTSSAAEIAKITKTPVILVLDVTRMTRTAAAVVMGCQHFDPDVEIVGVIANRVRGQRQELLLREVIEGYCQIPLLGCVPSSTVVDIPDRHLGLISSTEVAAIDRHLDSIAKHIASHVDLDAVLAMSATAQPLTYLRDCTWQGTRKIMAATARAATAQTATAARALQAAPAPQLLLERPAPASVKEPLVARPADNAGMPLGRACIGVLRDQAFSFYYPENLQALRDLGADLVFVDALHDRALPKNINALYIGGGFPEIFAAELEANEEFRNSVSDFALSGAPIWAECGGLMYLALSLEHQGKHYSMVGALPIETRMEAKRQAHGYSVLKVDAENPWFAVGACIKGHEFHHSAVVNADSGLRYIFMAGNRRGIANAADGICQKGIVASYTHVNAFASPCWAERFVEHARRGVVSRL